MTFTYTDTLLTDRDRIRFYLQDVVTGSGPKPSDGNFTDNEVAALVTVEGSWQRAVAAGFETLASAWRRYPNFKADGLTLSRSDIADGYAEQALEWRRRHGYGITTAGSRAVTRQDGYSDDIDSTED